jgi:hypothetical protein
MLKKICVIGLLAYWFIGLLGCTGMAKKDKELGSVPILEPQTMAKFSDIPAPNGFKFQGQESYAFESSGMRVAVLKYVGKADIDQVIAFYKEQMQMYNWNLLNIIEYGERLLNFERESETCIISLIPKGSTVLVTISLGPKSQRAPLKAERPVK